MGQYNVGLYKHKPLSRFMLIWNMTTNICRTYHEITNKINQAKSFEYKAEQGSIRDEQLQFIARVVQKLENTLPPPQEYLNQKHKAVKMKHIEVHRIINGAYALILKQINDSYKVFSPERSAFYVELKGKLGKIGDEEKKYCLHTLGKYLRDASLSFSPTINQLIQKELSDNQEVSKTPACTT